MITRAFALFIALLTFMNLLGDLAWPGFDANLWWISFGALPATALDGTGIDSNGAGLRPR